MAWNAFAQEIDGHWRTPIEGLTKGAGDAKVSETPESCADRAITYVPSTMAQTMLATVDVLLHFHGFGIGYGQLQPKAKSDYGGVLAAQQVRDIELYRVPQQLQALQSSGRPSSPDCSGASSCGWSTRNRRRVSPNGRLTHRRAISR